MAADDEQEDFASLLEQSLQARSFSVGDTVEGTVVALDADFAFIDVGSKGEAVMDRAELDDADGGDQVCVGDRIQAQVVSTAGGLKLSRRLALGTAAQQQLAAAQESGLPVEGRVGQVNKGGYEVSIAGQRAFCPMSQMDLSRGAGAGEHEGKVYTFRILEYREGGRNIVVSRRALLEAEERARAAEVRRQVVEGAVLAGQVVSVVSFGAFIDLGGGIQGLLHVSEMAWERVDAPADIVQPGQEISVCVLRVEEDGKKISLSLKRLTDDPWTTAAAAYRVGEVRTGRIARISDFGAFIELEPGIEALAHMSSFPRTSGGWKAAVQQGEEGTYRILNVDATRRRISVAPHEGMDAAGAGPGAVAPQPGAAGDGRGAERAAGQQKKDTGSGDEASGFGSLADKLRAAMKREPAE